MWTELQKSPAFFILFVKKSTFHILVTNYIRIWEVYYLENDFITVLKESNEGLEMDTNELLEKGIQMLTYPKELKSVYISTVGTTLEVTLTIFCGFPFNLNIILKEGPPELLFKKVLQPALKTIEDLKNSENILRKTLITKDDEIEQYKRLGGKIRYTAIAPYNDDAHMNKHFAFKKHYGNAAISKELLNKEVYIPSEDYTRKVKLEDITVKKEPTSQTTSNINEVEVNVVNLKTERVKMELPPRSVPRSKKYKLNI